VKRLLADTGYASTDDIAALGSRMENPVTAYVTPPADKENIKPGNLLAREKKRAKEPDVIKDWRKRMASEEGEAVMQRRGRIERVNAQAKNRGLGTMLVRGLAKVQCVALWHALEIWPRPSGCESTQRRRRAPHRREVIPLLLAVARRDS
jgi:hypothetical protein